MAVAAVSDAEEAFAAAWAAQRVLPLAPEREYRFHPKRRWRFDFAWPSVKVAVEIEGRGRHQTFTGYRADLEKYNEAVQLGWRILRFPASDYKLSHSRKLWPGGAEDWALETIALIACVPAR